MVTVNPSAALLAPDQQELWARVNDTAAELPAASPAARLVEHITAAPDRPAVIAARRQLSYGELGGLARALAGELIGPGAGPDAPVTISVEPGWEQVVAVAAALLAGAPFHPIDPTLPQSARWRRVADLGSPIVLTQSWLNERISWPETVTSVAVDTVTSASGPGSDAGAGGLPGLGTGPDHAMCVLAAGGSAGPLIVLAQAGLVNTVAGVNRALDIGGTDRLLGLGPLGDELSIYAVLGTLAAGATLVLPDDIDLRTPAVWTDLMTRHRVTVWLATPTLSALLVEHLQLRGEELPAQVRLAALAGEPVPPMLVSRLRAVAGRPVRVAHLGGAVAAGLWSCLHEVGEVDPRQKQVPLGAPLPNQRVYVLGEALTPCPVWVTGRVYLGGRGLAAGYWRDPAATAADFVELPATGERLYRTDRLGRLLPDGTIDVIGDDQTRITVKDHPLNLRDVEAALATHPSVLAAAVVPNGSGCTGFVRLAPNGRASGSELLDHLRTKMSPYLLPDRIEPVAALPLTPDGRTDRSALAAAAGAAANRAAEPAAAPAGSAELTERACELAARVIGVPDVDPTMNLLDLGATSVQLIRLAVQAEQELGIQVDVEELLRFPSVAILVSFPGGITAEVVEASGQATGADEAADGLILDPVARLDFKDRQLGIRRDLDAAPAIDLARPTGDRERLTRRRSHRAFATQPVPMAALGGLLGALRQLRSGVDMKYGYPSAGSLYPVQAYLTVAAGRVEGVPAGSYYYHPVRHRLVVVDPDAVVGPSAHAWINRDAFRGSAFSVYLVVDMTAIEPMYGDRARDYALIEAGAMCQLLMTTAAEVGLGLCPIGELETAALAEQLGLGEQRELVHTLLGGVPAPDRDDAAPAEMLGRLRTAELAGLDRAGDPQDAG